MPRTAEIHLAPDDVVIPAGLETLDDFRRWVRSDGFPERGRIDWIGHRVFVDMSGEDVNSHGTPKAAIARGLGTWIEDEDRGVVLVDRSRVSVPAADLSVEPDVLVLLFPTIESGRVKLIPNAAGDEESVTEIEGPPDLVVECVSRSSVKKDTEELFLAYAKAGVREYWLSDARGGTTELSIFRRHGRSFRAVKKVRGWLRSEVLDASVRLVRLPPRAGVVRHRLESR